MTHTPGPWDRNIPPARKYPVIFAGRSTHVAQVISRGLSDAEVEANCDLITAAPDLLAACKALLAEHRHEDPRHESHAQANAKRAIMRAEGKCE